MGFWKKIKFYLQHVDALWSVPVTIAAFWLLGAILQWIGGYGTGVYDLAFFQPLLLAAGVVIFATNIAIYVLFFCFRGLYKYFYGHKNANGEWVNQSKEDWAALPVPQRYLLAFSVFSLYVVVVIIVYLKLV